MRHKIIFVLSFSLIILVNCRPPKGWKQNSYIYNSGSRLSSSDEVRVKLHAGKAIAVYSRQKFLFRSKTGASINGRGKFIPTKEGEFIASDDLFKLKGKVYQGRLQVYQGKGSFIYVNVLPLEEYLVSVISHEMNKKWPLEALKAQAIVARTYAMMRMVKKSKKGSVNCCY